MTIGLFHRDGRNRTELEEWQREGRELGYLDSTPAEAPRPSVFGDAAARAVATLGPPAATPRVERELNEQAAWFQQQHGLSQAYIRRLQQQQSTAAEVVLPPPRSA
jgi:hypothetical protein